MLTAEVVLPTPPFWLATAIVRVLIAAAYTESPSRPQCQMARPTRNARLTFPKSD
jgi:hypothetical protein